MFKRPRKGISTIYMAVFMTVLCGLCSLAVDLGRVQLAKAEMRRAIDGAARAGAAGLVTSRAEAFRLAKEFAAKNKVEGAPLTLATAEIQIVNWGTNSYTIVPNAGLPKNNAVRIYVRRTIPLMFTKLLGVETCDITAECIAKVIPPIDVDANVPAQGNPFLAGMSYGSRASVVNPHYTIDYAGRDGNLRQSPLQINMPLSASAPLTFDSITGTARHDPNLDYFEPDGELGDIGHNNLTRTHANNYNSQWYNENGIADMKAPINALVGVFLDDNAPTQGLQNPAPPNVPYNLDFSTSGSRDFTELRPGMRQIFWIGDGLDSRGIRQAFYPPPGATRLFLATWDFYEWNNNAGFRRVMVQRPMQIITVR